MNLEQKIKHLVDQHLANNKSNTNQNNSNNNTNNNNNNNDDEKNESYKLVEKCLQEACKIYKFACFIELFIFLILISIFVYFNLSEINAEEFWEINSSLEKILFEKNLDRVDLNVLEDINENILKLFKDVILSVFVMISFHLINFMLNKIKKKGVI